MAAEHSASVDSVEVVDAQDVKGEAEWSAALAKAAARCATAVDKAMRGRFIFVVQQDNTDAGAGAGTDVGAGAGTDAGADAGTDAGADADVSPGPSSSDCTDFGAENGSGAGASGDAAALPLIRFDPSAAAEFVAAASAAEKTDGLEAVYLHSIAVLSPVVQQGYRLLIMSRYPSGEGGAAAAKLSLSTLRKWYGRLPRRARKGITQLILFKPSGWTKAALATARVIAKAKFFRKVQVASSYMQLKELVPLVELRMNAAHASAMLEELVHEIAVMAAGASANPGGGWKILRSSPDPMGLDELIQWLPPRVFGVSLEAIEGGSGVWGVNAPRMVEAAVACLSHPEVLSTEGLLRVPGSAHTIKLVRVCIEADLDVPLALLPDPNVVGALLKLYFRELPDPIIPPHLLDNLASETSEIDIGSLMAAMPPRHASTLFVVLLPFLAKVIRAPNKMTVDNVSVVFGPNLVVPASANPLDAMAASSKGVSIMKKLLLQQVISEQAAPAASSPAASAPPPSDPQQT